MVAPWQSHGNVRLLMAVFMKIASKQLHIIIKAVGFKNVHETSYRYYYSIQWPYFMKWSWKGSAMEAYESARWNRMKAHELPLSPMEAHERVIAISCMCHESSWECHSSSMNVSTWKTCQIPKGASMGAKTKIPGTYYQVYIVPHPVHVMMSCNSFLTNC